MSNVCCNIPHQIMHGDLILYVICNSREEQEEWIASIQDCKLVQYNVNTSNLRSCSKVTSADVVC